MKKPRPVSKNDEVGENYVNDPGNAIQLSPQNCENFPARTAHFHEFSPIPRSAPPPGSKLAQVQYYSERLQAGDTLMQIGVEIGLDQQQIAFVRAYSSQANVGGPGLAEVAEIYGYDLGTPIGKQRAYRTSAYLLRHEGVCTLLSVVLEVAGFNDSWVDRQLFYVVNQDFDLKAKLMGIELYMKLKQRLVKVLEVKVTQPVFDFGVFSPDELRQFIELAERAKVRGQDTTGTPLIG